MPKAKTETKGIVAGWSPVSKTELSMMPLRQRGGVYKEVLDSFIKSGDEAWKREGLTNAQVTGFQLWKIKEPYKGKVTVTSHQEGPTKKGEPYKGAYTVILQKKG
jgi:hypothetical protein